jgi:GDP-D-mannose dehydratase
MTDSTNLIRLVRQVQPTKSITLPLKAMSPLVSSRSTANADALRVLIFWEAIRILKLENDALLW